IHRYAIVANNRQQLLDKLAAQEWKNFTLHEKASYLAFLFPGQGAQYAKMGSDLYQKEPAYQLAVDRCAEILQTEMGEDIRSIIFAPDDGQETLRDTYYTQP